MTVEGPAHGSWPRGVSLTLDPTEAGVLVMEY